MDQNSSVGDINQHNDINIIKDIADVMHLFDLVYICSHPDLDVKNVRYKSNEFHVEHLQLYKNDKSHAQCVILHSVNDNLMIMHIFYYGISEYHMNWFFKLMDIDISLYKDNVDSQILMQLKDRMKSFIRFIKMRYIVGIATPNIMRIR